MGRPLLRGRGLILALTVSAPVIGLSPVVDESPAASSTPYTVQTNVSYGADEYQDMDIYLPKGYSQPTPAVILVHGGSFSAGDKTQQDDMAASLASVGWAGIAINYRLLGWPYEPEDVLSAIAWVRANAATLNIDPTALAVQGSSSGGTVVLEAISDAAELGGSAAGVRAISSWSGPTDLPTLVTSGISTDIIDPISGYLSCTYDDCPDTYSDASAVDHVSSDLPPAFLATGSQEVIPVSQANELADDLAQVGDPSQVFVIPGSLHGQLYEPEAMQPMVNFFSTYLGPTTGPVPSISPPPTVSSVNPSVYPGEKQVQLIMTGSLFDPGAGVETDAPDVTVGKVYVPKRSQIQFGLTVGTDTPPGSYNLVEDNPDQTAAQCLGCLIVTAAPPPTLSAITPSRVGTGNTYTFTVTGTGFTSDASMSLSDVGAVVVSSADRNSTSASVTVRFPITASAGSSSATVTTPGGQATCVNCLTVDPAPKITFVTGLVAGTTTLATVTGSGFASGLSPATNIPGASVGAVTNLTPSSFQVPITVPAAAPKGTSYGLRVTNLDGGVGSYSALHVN